MNIKEQIQKRGFTVSQVATLMTNKNEEITKLLLQCDTLKAHLLGLRPLPPDALQKIENAFAIEYTYESNRIEGNTLTLQETELVVNEGVTIAGKSMREHLDQSRR